jgi:integrase/recombinase XerD
MLHLDLKLFNQYLTLKKLSDKTKKEYLLYALRFQNIGGFNNEAISHFLINPTNQNNVARAFISVLKKYLIYNRKELQLTEEEFKEIVESEIPTVTGRKKQKINIPLTKEEMELMERTLITEEEKLMFLVCYNGGLRLQELIRIKANSFNWNSYQDNPDKMGEVLVYGKGNKEGISLIPNWLMKRIETYIMENLSNPEEKLFKLSGRTFESRIREAGIKSGITKKDENGEYIQSSLVHPHKLRHQLGYDLTKRGIDIRYIRDILRHSSITSTQIYTQLSKDDLKEKMESVNNPQNSL